MACSAEEFFRKFTALLDQVSSSTTLPLTGYREKWRIVSEILLGHPLVRGGARPRDYPMGNLRRVSADLGLALIEAVDSTTALGGELPYRLYDFVAALQATTVAFRPGVVDPPSDDVCGYGRLIVGTLQNVFSTLVRDDRKALPFLEKVCELLAISPHEQQVGGLKGKGGFKKEDAGKPDRILWAKAAAAISHEVLRWVHKDRSFLRADLESRRQALGVEHQRARQILSDLGSRRFRIIRLKARKVQDFIGRCLTPPVQRGASAWCSQTTARWRDHLLQSPETEGSLALASDSDAAVVLFAMPDFDPSRLDASHGHIQKPESVRLAYPRLAPYLGQARSEGLSIEDLNPALNASIEETNLLTFALDPKEYQRAPRALRAPAQPDPADDRQNSCSGVRGHVHFEEVKSRVGSWWAGHSGEKYGPVGLAYTLSGTAYSKMTGRGMREELATINEALEGVVVVSRQSDLLERAEDDFLFLVRIDGDRVGGMFAESPALSRAGLSLRVESELRTRWLSALAKLMLKHHCDFIPIILIYFGGDDLQFICPAKWLDELLDDLKRQDLSRLSYGPELRCTVAAVPLERHDWKVGKTRQDAAHDRVSHLIHVAKEEGRDDQAVLQAVEEKVLGSLNVPKHLRVRQVGGPGFLHGVILKWER